MKKITILLIFLMLNHCSLNKVSKKHGVRNLENSYQKLIINQTNINEIKEILGPPSTNGAFNDNNLIYIEREISKDKIYKFGKDKIVKNNIIILDIDNKGILISKKLIDINEMNKLEISKLQTSKNYSKNTFIYDFLSSMRQKINDPLGKRKKP
jgi:outer membrane protein assembly factor BamE (lipoprotein component of BamABCDE complex)